MQLNKKKARLLTAALIILFILLSAIATKLSENTEVNNNLSNMSEIAKNIASMVVINDFKRNLTKDGKKVWEVIGKKAEYIPGQNAIKITNCELVILKNPNEQVQVKSDEALVYIKENQLANADLNGNVQIIGKNNVKLTSNQAKYQADTGKIFADGQVVIESKMMKISGYKLEGDVNSQEFILKENVTSEIRAKDKDENN